MTFAPNQLYAEEDLKWTPTLRKRLVATGLLEGVARGDGGKSWLGRSIEQALAAVQSHDSDHDDDDPDDDDRDAAELPGSPADDEEDDAEEEAARELRRARGRRGAAKREASPAEPDEKGRRLAMLAQENEIKAEMLRTGKSRIEAATRVARRDPAGHQAFLMATNAGNGPTVQRAIRRRGRVSRMIREQHNR
jgi:hypothetical protein